MTHWDVLWSVAMEIVDVVYTENARISRLSTGRDVTKEAEILREQGFICVNFLRTSSREPLWLLTDKGRASL